MSGQKSTAEFLSDRRTPFNFAVPSKHVLQTNQVFQSSDIKPGLLPNILDTYECSKTFKLCVDGKKLNISSKPIKIIKTQAWGDRNMWIGRKTSHLKH